MSQGRKNGTGRKNIFIQILTGVEHYLVVSTQTISKTALKPSSQLCLVWVKLYMDLKGSG